MAGVSMEVFEQVCMEAMEEMRKLVPYTPYTARGFYHSSGNMRFNAFKYKMFANTFILYIDEAIAPYVSYTNEPWIAARWGDNKNPNEGWFDRAAEFVAKYIADRLKGELTKND